MPLHDLNTLLIDAPVNRHFAQFHKNSQEATSSVALFVETGLRRKNGVLAVLGATHKDMLLERLRRNGLDPAPFRRSGQLQILDAELTLKHIMRGDMPDWETFRAVVGKAIEGVQTFGRTTVRVYGELVGLLWREGNADAAIRLEEFWNELARLYPFSLFCSYMVDYYAPACYHGPLSEIGRTHSDVIATAEDERFRHALETASRDVFGAPLSEVASGGFAEQRPGEAQLPAGQRAMLWITRNRGASTATILEHARRYQMESLR
jgi:hypothetical protein